MKSKYLPSLGPGRTELLLTDGDSLEKEDLDLLLLCFGDKRRGELCVGHIKFEVPITSGPQPFQHQGPELL